MKRRSVVLILIVLVVGFTALPAGAGEPQDPRKGSCGINVPGHELEWDGDCWYSRNSNNDTWVHHGWVEGDPPDRAHVDRYPGGEGYVVTPSGRYLWVYHHFYAGP